jgi:hypothetical protein
MYAIAHYKTPDGKNVPTCGSMTKSVIHLKTLRGIWNRARAEVGTLGRGDLFAVEVWNHEDRKYDKPDSVYIPGGLYMVRSFLSFYALVEQFNRSEAIANA